MAWQRVDIKRYTSDRQVSMFNWLAANVGPEGAQWRLALGYDFLELYIQEEIYTLFALRWA